MHGFKPMLLVFLFACTYTSELFLGASMELLIMAASLLFLGLFFFLFLSKWNEIILQRKGLPPGTMGWPFFGETHVFLKLGPEFMKRQRARYGAVFKTHMLGSPTVISMDPELNRYILLNEAKGLVPGYPISMLDLLGKNIAAVHGSKHKVLRHSMLSIIGAPLLKGRLLPMLDTYIRLHLSEWEDGMVIDLQRKSTDMAFLMSFTQIVESEFDSIYYRLKDAFDKLHLGSLSLPINLPGTSYYRGLEGRRDIVKLLTQVIEKRRASPETHDDTLDHLLTEMKTKYELSDEEIIDQFITILYSGYETVSTTSMMAVKYLDDDQEAMQELKHENFEIRRKKAAEQPLDWEDYKSMRFTRAVVLETLRLATVVNGLLRKTTEDIELNGFFIPKGWRVYVYTREINYDPIMHPEPLKFNPWRWLDKNLESHNYFLLFGGGSRMCPGKELGIATISTFLHYLVTTYRWEEVGGDEMKVFPRVEAPNGYHIKVMKL